MDENDLFLQTLDDLRERLKKGNAYSLLRATGLLRQLLLDGSPLVHRVNQPHHVLLVFEVPAAKEDWEAMRELMERFEAEFWAAGDVLHRSGSQNTEFQALSLDEFLGFPVMLSGTRWLSVRDVISHGANVAGGVHSGAPRGAKQAALSELDSIILGGRKAMVPPILQVRSIGRVVLDALQPLEAAVRR